MLDDINIDPEIKYIVILYERSDDEDEDSVEAGTYTIPGDSSADYENDATEDLEDWHNLLLTARVLIGFQLDEIATELEKRHSLNMEKD